MFDGRATGRLLRLERGGAVRVVADGLAFANGLAAQDDGRRLILAETFGGRLWQFDPSGAGAPTVLAELPCFPDNLSSVRGLLAVGCSGYRGRAASLLMASPWLRKASDKEERGLLCVEAHLEQAALAVLTPQQLLGLVPLYAAVVLVDPADGSVRQVWQGKGMAPVSEAVQVGDTVFLGSWRAGTTLLRMPVDAPELWQ